MSETKFTKGPWRVCDYNSHIVQLSTFIGFQVPAPHEVRGDGSFGMNYNAALIAAAPEMYELLNKLMMAEYQFTPTEIEIKKLLAKARGE